MAGYAHPEMLVDTAWVALHKDDPGVRLAEVDVDTSAYEQGHVPGAIAWNWTTQLCDPVRRDVIPKDAFEQLMVESGVGNDTTVILYGDNNNWFAAWALWQMKLYGHKDVRLMNGGRRKWVEEGRELATAVPGVARASYRATGPDLSLRAFLSEAMEASATRSKGFVDVRSPDEFSGKILAPPRPARDLPAGRPHPGRRQHPLGPGVQPGWHLQVVRRAQGAVRRQGHHRRPADHRLLPDRRALEPFVVRPQVPAWLRQGEELRRLLDRVG